MEFRLADLLRRITPGGLIPLGSAESKKKQILCDLCGSAVIINYPIIIRYRI